MNTSVGAREVGEANTSYRGGRELADGVLELAGAAREEGRTDGWGYPVSDRVREREMAQGAGSARAGLGRSQAGRPKGHSDCSLFLLCKIVMYV